MVPASLLITPPLLTKLGMKLVRSHPPRVPPPPTSNRPEVQGGNEKKVGQPTWSCRSRTLLWFCSSPCRKCRSASILGEPDARVPPYKFCCTWYIDDTGIVSSHWASVFNRWWVHHWEKKSSCRPKSWKRNFVEEKQALPLTNYDVFLNINVFQHVLVNN